LQESGQEETVRRFVYAGLIAVAAVTCAALATAAAGQAPKAGAKAKADGRTLKNPVAMSDASVKRGRQVFVKYCVSCHGNSGKGDGSNAPEGSMPADLTDAKWDHGATDGEIFITIRDGVGPKFDMDSWASKLETEEIWNVVNYIRSLGPKT
jgi:mono/diheme cytochrome c family protein